MKTWVWALLLVAVVLFLWTVRREGVDDTLTRTPECPNGMTLEDDTCRRDHGPPTICPPPHTVDQSGVCTETTASGEIVAFPRLCTEGTNLGGRCISTRPPNCPSGYVIGRNGQLGPYTCITTAAAAAATTAAAEPAAPRPNAAPASGYAAVLEALGQGPTGGTGATGTSGNTTGGSTTTQGANSGTNKGNIFGPAFTGFGENTSGSGGLGARDYPTLIGPKPVASRYIEGAGVMNLSQSDNLAKSGALPGAAGTGSDPNSRFFGSSRVPGDRDLIPDAGQQFTPSIGSSKTEPVPYLADFSAFAT
jgi:hypothetical protein